MPLVLPGGGTRARVPALQWQTNTTAPGFTSGLVSRVLGSRPSGRPTACKGMPTPESSCTPSSALGGAPVRPLGVRLSPPAPGAGPERDRRSRHHARAESRGASADRALQGTRAHPGTTNPCCPPGLCSYFLSTEDLPRRRQLYRYVGRPHAGLRLQKAW